ncbi:MAG TPA: tetratricopeptide repeat protein, partial [Catalimonadaceae bacterium]|nr:tetratricopeptide repeat protein [Catalimonadaceae bacterium]
MFTTTLSGSVLAQRTLSVQSPDPRLKIAFDLMERHNYQAAMAEFQSFSQETGASADLAMTARYYAAHCALKLYHPDAEEQLLAFNQRNPGSVYESRVWFDLANYYFRIKKWETAVQYYTRIPADGLEEESQIEADFKTGVSCFQLQQFDRAKSYFQKLRRKDHPYKGSAAYYTAYLNFKDGLLDDALADLDVAKTSPEYKSSIPVLKASILYKKKEYKEVIDLGEETFKDTARIANPEELHLLVGESYFNQKEYTKAAGHFETYSKGVRGNLPRGLQFRVAFTYFKTDQTDKAIAGFRQVAARLDTTKGKQDSLGQYGSYYLGICYLKKDQKQFAYNAFDLASEMKADPHIQEVAWFNAGKLAYDLEKYSDAVDILKDFVDNYPKSSHVVEANELIGEGLLNSNDFEAALAYMENARVKTDRLSLAYQRAAYQRGTTLFNDGNT